MTEWKPRAIFGAFVLAALSGAVIAWVLTAIVLYAIFAIGGYTRESLVELSPCAFGLIGGGGALTAVAAVLQEGRAALPRSVWMTGVGSLVGVVMALVVTVAFADFRGGPTSKGWAPYLEAGLFYGVPIALVVGGLGGFLVSRAWSGQDGVHRTGSR